MQISSSNQTISAVISWPYQGQYSTSDNSAQQSLHLYGYSQSCVLHQHIGGQPYGSGVLLKFAHLPTGDNLQPVSPRLQIYSQVDISQ
jgi:hypothetical protein